MLMNGSRKKNVILENGLAVFIIAIILLIIIPLSPIAMDFLIIFNILFSLVIFILTMYVKDTLEFSVFPSLLLITTLLRVGLNVASTRLILGNNGSAGAVIETFGEFVIGGNPIVGLVIFIIIVIIQFLVITKGAERVSEVSARFTLDAMPGKQMAIDADLNAGIIDEQMAKERRLKVQREADFYGAMDGASKFVKGDAIVSIIVMVINILGGTVIGLINGSGDIGQILTLFTIATVGGGLAAQVPALMVSTAMGMIVTRSASENSLGKDLSNQLLAQPMVLILSGGALLVLFVIPGMPKAPLLVLGGGFLALGLQLRKQVKPEPVEIPEAKETKTETDYYRNIDNIYNLLNVEQIEMEFGYSLIPLVDESQGSTFIDSVVMLRKQFATEMGMVVSAVRLRDNSLLKPNEYVIKIKGEHVARGEVLADRYLAIEHGNVEEPISGINTYDPTFGLPAKWIASSDRDEAEIRGYTVIDPQSVIITHLSEVIKQHAHEILTRQDVNALIDNLRKTNKQLVDDIIPNIISMADLKKVLGNLLKEHIPIKDLATILEVIGDYGAVTKDTDMLTEYVRQGLRRTITRLYVQDNKLKVIALDPDLEKLIMSNLRKTEYGSYVALDPQTIEKIIANLTEYTNKMKELLSELIVLASPVIRFYFKKMVEQSVPDITVLSLNEIDPQVEVTVIGVLNING